MSFTDLTATNNLFVLAAILTFSGSSVSGILLAWMTYRFGRKASKAAADAATLAVQVAEEAKRATAKTQEDAALAQAGVIKAAERLIKVAQGTDVKLQAVVDAASNTDITLNEIATTGKVIHKIVNSQRTAMLRLIADLRREIATGKPGNEVAEQAAIEAEGEAKTASDTS